MIQSEKLNPQILFSMGSDVPSVAWNCKLKFEKKKFPKIRHQNFSAAYQGVALVYEPFLVVKDEDVPWIEHQLNESAEIFKGFLAATTLIQIV